MKQVPALFSVHAFCFLISPLCHPTSFNLPKLDCTYYREFKNMRLEQPSVAARSFEVFSKRCLIVSSGILAFKPELHDAFISCICSLWVNIYHSLLNDNEAPRNVPAVTTVAASMAWSNLKCYISSCASYWYLLHVRVCGMFCPLYPWGIEVDIVGQINTYSSTPIDCH